MDINEFSIIWVDAYTYVAKTGVPKHKHEYFHFIYVDSGEGEITIAEKKYSMGKGKIYLIPPFVDHAFFNADDTPLKTLEIKFRLGDAGADHAIKNLPREINAKNFPVRLALQTIIEEKIKNVSMSDEIADLNFKLFLIYLVRCHNQQSGDLPTGEELEKFPPKTFPEIDRVIAYIHDNMTEDISLEKMAELSGFEKNYFLRKFKRQTGRTPMAFVTDVRMEKVKELLRYSDMNISQIACATGFNSIHYFSNLFFKHTGKRPLKYRNDNKIK